VTISPEEREQRRKQAEAVRIQQEYRKRLLTEIYKRAPAELGRHELDLIALSHFQQLGHDSQHRIFKFFAWEEAKSKAPNGAYVDYPKPASAKLEKMTAAEIGKFLVVCALATELYFPTCYGVPAGKDSKLIREATHYKVNGNRILVEVKEQFTKKPAKSKTSSKPQV
jgi:hypothetical protein